MSTFLYARVSTSEQTVENQVLAAERAGYKIDKIFSDSDVSGSVKSSDREKYFEMISEMKDGDVVIVSEVSRIARKTIDVLTQLEVYKDKNVRLCVMAFGNLDLTSDIGELVVTMAAALASMELKDLKRRTKAGMERVKKEGTKLGPPLKLTPDEFEDIVREKESGQSVDSICLRRKLAPATVYKNLKQWGNNTKVYRQEFTLRQSQYAKAAALRS